MGTSNSLNCLNIEEDTKNEVIEIPKEDELYPLWDLRKESIQLLNEIFSNDKKIVEILEIKNGKMLELEYEDISHETKKEIKNFSIDLKNIRKDKINEDILNQLNKYKKLNADFIKFFQELIFTLEKKSKEIKVSLEDIETEAEETYKKCKEIWEYLSQYLNYIIKGIEIRKFKQKYIEERINLYLFRTTENLLYDLFKGFKEVLMDDISIIEDIINIRNSVYSLLKNKILEKLKETIFIINEGMTFISQISEKINKRKQQKLFFDEMKNELFKNIISIENQIYNKYNEINSYFGELNDKITRLKEDLEMYNLKEIEKWMEGFKKGVDEIRKIFKLKPLKLNIQYKDIQSPYSESLKKINKQLEQMKEIKEEVQKGFKLVQINFIEEMNITNSETFDILFILDITESMQDLLDETRNSIKYISENIKKEYPGILIRFAFEGYRDFEDMKTGEKYYTIDFETDLDVFKKKLEEIVAKGGWDDAEDVLGGLHSGYNMSWRSNARLAILICDAPCHGKKYHDNDVEDDYPNGDPNGLILEDLMKKYVEKNINLVLTRIDDYTDKMFKIMKDSYNEESQKSKDKPKIQTIKYEYEENEEFSFKEIITKTAIDIFKIYSKKNN
jgi:hypothetical protein